MEKIIITLALCLIWFSIDKFILEVLNRLPDARLEKAMIILRRSRNEAWMLERYKLIKVYRMGLFLSLFIESYINFMMIYVLGLILVYQIPAFLIVHEASKRVALVRYQFPIYLRQLQVLLQNNTVVKTIELSLDFIPEVLTDDITDLFYKIKEEPLELKHYLDCMKQYDLPEIHRAMKWLYRYQSIGYQDAYRQFNRMIVSTSKWLRKSRQELREQNVMVVQWLGLMPLFGVTLVFIAAMMSVALSLFERG
jgi:hypothetical protein